MIYKNMVFGYSKFKNIGKNRYIGIIGVFYGFYECKLIFYYSFKVYC